MAFTSETKKELENYISGHLPNKEWYESHKSISHIFIHLLRIKV